MRADPSSNSKDAAHHGSLRIVAVGMIGIGVIGAGSMVARLAVLPAISASTRATLAAASSLSTPPSSVWSDVSVADYQAVLDHPDVDAVYIPLPNAMHEEWTIKAAAAGKHVLCEKPIAVSVQAAERMRKACDDAGVLLAEAWMTPFDPRWAEVMRLASTGLVGAITEVRSTFTFTIGPEASDNYRWDPAQGGGALLDVGIYCLGPAVQLWGSKPSHIDASITSAALPGSGSERREPPGHSRCDLLSPRWQPPPGHWRGQRRGRPRGWQPSPSRRLRAYCGRPVGRQPPPIRRRQRHRGQSGSRQLRRAVGRACGANGYAACIRPRAVGSAR